jgi:hypothetical protein
MSKTARQIDRQLKFTANELNRFTILLVALYAVWEECSPHQLPGPEPFEKFFNREIDRMTMDIQRRIDGYE